MLPAFPSWPWTSAFVPYHREGSLLDAESGRRRDSPSVHHRLVPPARAPPIALWPWMPASVPYRESRFDVPHRERLWVPGRLHSKTPPSVRHRLPPVCSIQRAQSFASPKPVPMQLGKSAGEGATLWHPVRAVGADHRLFGLPPLYVAPLDQWPLCVFCKDPEVVADVFCG